MSAQKSAKPALAKLKSMIGKPFLYRGNQIVISNYHVIGEEGKTQIDLEGAEPIKTDNLSKFVDQCLPVDDTNGRQETGISTVVVQETNNLLGTLQQTLLENIQNVKANKDYIKQANVINSSVNALIGMAKLQIQVGKMKAVK